MTPREPQMETASLISSMMVSSRESLFPFVGMGATEICWTDRHAYSVIEVSKNGRRVKAQRNKVTRTDTNGMSESQAYQFEPDPTATVLTLSLRKDGRWRRVADTQLFALGHRSEYHDYSF